MDNYLLLGYLVQIIAAELMFLYPADRREYFRLRFCGGLALLFLAAWFLPVGDFDNVFFQLFVFLAFFFLNVGLMYLCFDLKYAAVTASCVAGYAVQHIAYHVCLLLGSAGVFRGATLKGIEDTHLREMVFFPVIYFLFWLTLGRFSAKNECYRRYDRRFHLVSFATVFITVGLTRFATAYGSAGTATVSLYAITACMMALIVQMVLFRAVSLQHENETLSLLWQEEKRQYEVSKKTIDTINIKYHDLKHRMKGMNIPQEEAESIQDALRIYGSQFKTGNDALDVLLTENSLRCGEEGIVMSFMGNGGDFSFMNTMDVYSLFGNAIDNAVEAVRQVKDPEKRIIDITTERRGDMVNVCVVNFFSGELLFEDGVPSTTKTGEEGYHGFGVRSMQRIAEKYGGRLNIQAEEGEIFRLNAYLLRKQA